MPLHLGWQDVALRLALTVAAGVLIGINRTERGRAAGLRTTLLVCLAASVSMIQANLLLDTAGKASDSFITLDLMRLPLGILTGMGFIGGGAILRQGDRVQGVTTAATMWFVTVIGLCFGGGQNLLGLAALALGVIVLCALKAVEDNLGEDHQATLTLRLAADGPTEEDIRTALRTAGFETSSWQVIVAGRRRASRQHRRQRPARHRQTMPRQPPRQHRPAPRQPSRERALGHAELPGGFPARLAFQIAQHDGGTIPGRQPAQLLVENRLQIAPEILLARSGLAGSVISVTCLSRARLRAALARAFLVRHPVEPVGDHVARRHRSRFADEDEEGGLKSVFGILVTRKDATAHSPDHRGMPSHQGGEGGIIPPRDEAFQKLPIGHPRPIRPQQGPAEVWENRVHWAGRHQAPYLPVGVPCPLPNY